MQLLVLRMNMLFVFLLQSFGHEHMLTFNSLKQLGLYTEPDVSQFIISLFYSLEGSLILWHTTLFSYRLLVIQLNSFVCLIFK